MTFNRRDELHTSENQKDSIGQLSSAKYGRRVEIYRLGRIMESCQMLLGS